ncbi:hypothetical protein BpsS36_00063 [Bacillus phage vB_BpsS-36]|uniref:Uncharacterized protein n=1 Tax=Bacillus phage vB_BpsS-36 TaxID=2419622 RepID=A0A3G3BWV3_9CAUD|nr:hypothetical protein BpsS36_00063 [Bacillus phage vB_BpsS-36]
MIAVYVLSNNSSVNVYRVEHGIDDEVLAGLSGTAPEWCKVEYDDDRAFFKVGELTVYLDECMRV